MEHLENLVSEVSPLLKARGAVDSGAVISVGVKLAARVNALKGLSGLEKRDLVVAVLIRALEKMKAEELKKAAEESSLVTSIEARYTQLVMVVRDVLPAAVDAAIDAARGKLNLKKIKPSVLLRYCSCFAATAVSVLSSAGVISGEDAKKADLIVRKVENVSVQVVEKVEAAAAAAGVSLPGSEEPAAAVPVPVAEPVVPAAEPVVPVAEEPKA